VDRFSKAESYEKTLRIIISQEKDFFPQGERRLKMNPVAGKCFLPKRGRDGRLYFRTTIFGTKWKSTVSQEKDSSDQRKGGSTFLSDQLELKWNFTGREQEVRSITCCKRVVKIVE
jgi:hypothetical protein